MRSYIDLLPPGGRMYCSISVQTVILPGEHFFCIINKIRNALEVYCLGLAVGVGFGAIGRTKSATFERSVPFYEHQR